MKPTDLHNTRKIKIQGKEYTILVGDACPALAKILQSNVFFGVHTIKDGQKRTKEILERTIKNWDQIIESYVALGIPRPVAEKMSQPEMEALNRAMQGLPEVNDNAATSADDEATDDEDPPL